MVRNSRCDPYAGRVVWVTEPRVVWSDYSDVAVYSIVVRYSFSLWAADYGNAVL